MSPLCHPLPSPEQMINFTGWLMPPLMDLEDMMVSSKAHGSGVSNRGAAISRPVARTAHIWKDRDFIYDGEMTAGVDGARNDAATTPLRHLRPEEISKVSEINGLALYFQNREIKQTLMNFRLVLI